MYLVYFETLSYHCFFQYHLLHHCVFPNVFNIQYRNVPSVKLVWFWMYCAVTNGRCLMVRMYRRTMICSYFITNFLVIFCVAIHALIIEGNVKFHCLVTHGKTLCSIYSSISYRDGLQIILFGLKYLPLLISVSKTISSLIKLHWHINYSEF